MELQQQLQPQECQARFATCPLPLRLIEACPFLPPAFSPDYMWQIYMILSTCLPYTILAFVGLHWLVISKGRYFPSCVLTSAFAVPRSHTVS